MDLEEWEVLPHGGFLDYHEDGDNKSSAASRRSSSLKSVFDMNYFVCPSSSPPRNSRMVPNQLVPVPFQLEPTTIITGKEQEDKSKAIEIRVVPLPDVKGPDIASKEANQDPVSQVFFKKMKENEFVDMKIDSPKSPTSKSFAPPQIDAAKFNFDDKGETLESVSSPRLKNEKEILEVEEVSWEENSGGLNLWKWSLNGIGAICSFGVAAATVCIIIFGSHQRNKQQQNQRLRFQIYSDDKVSTNLFNFWKFF